MSKIDEPANNQSFPIFTPKHLHISHPRVAIADTGATEHYFRSSSLPFLSNPQAGPPVRVSTPDGGTMISTKKATLVIGGAAN